MAIAWIGQELPAWKVRCPIKVKVTAGEAGGLTSFGFAGNGWPFQVITVEGRVDRILASSLPHEVTHTIFAAYFGGPMPRWADEGASLLRQGTTEEIRRHLTRSYSTRRTAQALAAGVALRVEISRILKPARDIRSPASWWRLAVGPGSRLQGRGSYRGVGSASARSIAASRIVRELDRAGGSPAFGS